MGDISTLYEERTSRINRLRINRLRINRLRINRLRINNLSSPQWSQEDLDLLRPIKT